MRINGTGCEKLSSITADPVATCSHFDLASKVILALDSHAELKYIKKVGEVLCLQ